MLTFILSSFIALVRALEIPYVVSQCSFRPVGRVVKGGVVSVHSYFPDWIADPCVGLSRVIHRLTKDVQGLDSGPIQHIGLSALAIHWTQTCPLFPWCTITWQGFMFILVLVLKFRKWWWWWCWWWLCCLGGLACRGGILR